jgi:cell division protein FtsQ
MSNRDSNVRSLERRRRDKKRKRVLVGFAIFLLAGLAIYAAYFSTWLTVKKVSVIGNQIASAALIQTEANISIGTPLARVNSDEINQNLADISSVDHVEVRRAWPNEIVLAVSERIAVATIKKSNYWVFVDAKGVEYGKTFNQPKNLMIFEVSKKAARVEVAKVFTSMPGWLKAQTKSLSATSLDNVRISLGNSRQAIVGDASRLERKFSVLKVLMTQKAKVYDVSAPDVPVTRK